MTVKTVTQEEIRTLARPLWPLVGACSWTSYGPFEQPKAAALGIVAQLAYCHVELSELQQPRRANVVPCEIYRRIVAGGQVVNVVEILRMEDFANTGIVSTRRFVALILPVRELLLVGIRGTQYAYDWYYNLRFQKRRDRILGSGVRFHRGFLAEAGSLAGQLKRYIRTRYAHKDVAPKTLYLSGHSLGGAIAGILNATPWGSPLVGLGDCYVYGAPRIASAGTLATLRNPFATRRTLDVVPHVPPERFGFANFTHQLQPDGSAYLGRGRGEVLTYLKWLAELRAQRITDNHSIERYRYEMMFQAGQDARIQASWHGPGPFL